MNTRDIIHSVARIIYYNTGKPVPKVQTLAMSSQEVKQEIVDLKLKLLSPSLLDFFQDYYYTTAEGWAEVFDYIYFRFDMPEYIAGRMDCDDFAFLMKSLISAFFGLNYFSVVLGDSPLGYHAWNLFRTEERHMQLEPQDGEFFELTEKGYKPEYILL
mgnify:CR=1 FL=1